MMLKRILISSALSLTVLAMSGCALTPPKAPTETLEIKVKEVKLPEVQPEVMEPITPNFQNRLCNFLKGKPIEQINALCI
ncbi:o-spanin [Serratia phage Moabite]|uniref:O-spanin n=1 Tax=Serratia phage Moabite TaxID=2587814 RepID=A0A4Y5TQB7_9CAUD|nr:o-spanin [Serratia phage Moabite]QDB71173.1 o-spanin [Serratia phage Moabite]